MDNELNQTFPSHDDIAARAYERFIERGCVDGHDREDWLAAEQDLLEQCHDALDARDAVTPLSLVEPTHAE